MVLNLLSDSVNGVRTSSDCLEIWSKNGKEFLQDDASLLNVLHDLDHVEWLGEDVSGFLEFPSLHSSFLFNLLSGVIELLVPFFKHNDTLLDQVDGLLWVLLKDGANVDFLLDSLADFVGDGFQEVFHLRLVLVDVSRDSPDELKSVKEGWKGLLDDSEASTGDVLELSFESSQELHEVFSLSMLLLEFSVLVIVALVAVAIVFLSIDFHNF